MEENNNIDKTKENNLIKIEKLLRENKTLRTILIIITACITIFFVFTTMLLLSLNQLLNPFSSANNHMDKAIMKQIQAMDKFETYIFESANKTRDEYGIYGISRENDAYKIIVDLKPLNGDEKAVSINANGHSLSIKIDKHIKDDKTDKKVNFVQQYYLQDTFLPDKITKIKKDDLYTITIPYKVN